MVTPMALGMLVALGMWRGTWMRTVSGDEWFGGPPGGPLPCPLGCPRPRYGIQMRVHDRYCSAHSRSAKQKSKKKALQ